MSKGHSIFAYCFVLLLLENRLGKPFPSHHTSTTATSSHLVGWRLSRIDSEI